MKQKNDGILQRVNLPRIIIPALDGQRRIIDAKNVFTGEIEIQSFKTFKLDKPASKTPATEIEAYDVVKEGTLKEAFACLGDCWDNFLLTQHQIIWLAEHFAQNWFEEHRPRANEYFRNHFLIRRGKRYFEVRCFVGLPHLSHGFEDPRSKFVQSLRVHAKQFSDEFACGKLWCESLMQPINGNRLWVPKVKT
jgi:hypothetical protein